MSHSRERAEKTCLNCHTQLHGRYCHICGQENTDPRESFWSLLSHFFNDITHFDGKFFKTTGLLLSKPGFLPAEFIAGRRARYLHPIRMYLFTSALFFIIFYSVTSPERIAKNVGFNDLFVNPVDTLVAASPLEQYTTVEQYDSAQQRLPKEKRDSWYMKQLRKKNIIRKSTYGGRSDMMVKSIMSNLIHSFPYLLFMSLPLSALFLQVLYIRHRNNLYAGNAMFLVYLYIFTFIVLLAYFGLSELQSAFHLGWIGYLKFALLVYIAVYTLMAFRRYYAQGWGKTMLKFVIWNTLALITILFLFIVFLLISLVKV